MKSIEIKNEFGETIELKRDSSGKIMIRHSDIDEVRWGEFVDPGTLADFYQRLGLDSTDPETKAMITLVEAFRGARVRLNRQDFILSEQEVSMIRGAISAL